MMLETDFTKSCQISPSTASADNMARNSHSRIFTKRMLPGSTLVIHKKVLK